MLTNPLYGMAIAPNLIDLPAFNTWAAFNDELVTNQDGTQVRRHVFAGTFDQAGDAWHALGIIAGMARASIVQLGMRYTVILDAPGDPVQLFTIGNTKKDSFQEQWMALDDRCTLIECDFADAARNYRMDLPVSVMTATDINSGLQPKVTRTKLTGCTSRDQAWRWAYFHLMSTKLTLRTVQFSAPIEAVCCQLGSVIALQSDVVQWGVGGRVQPGSTLYALNVERTDLTFAPASGYTVSVQHPVVQRGTAQVQSVSGLNVTMTAALPAGRIVKAVVPSGTEYIVTGYGNSTITLSGSTGTITAGQVITLYDTNVIDNRSVTGVTVGAFGSQVAIAGSFSAVPITDSAWAYGQSAGSQPAKLFRVVSIKKSGDFAFDVAAMEYNAEIYEDVIPNYGEIVGVPDSSPVITDLTLVEQFQNGTITGSSNSAVVSVGWRNNNTAVGAQVKVQASGGTWNTLGNIQGQSCTFAGTIGTTYNVSVTGFDWQGNLLGNPVTGLITVQASTNVPANVTGFTCAMTNGLPVLNWTAVTGADHYEIRYQDSQAYYPWDTATVLWDGTGTTWTDTTLRNGMYMIVAVLSVAAGGLMSLIPAYITPYPDPPIVTISQSATNTSGSGGSSTASAGITVNSNGSFTTAAIVWLTISWTWPGNYPTPSAFNVIAFTGSDPTATANYLFDMVTVGPSTTSYTVAVTPTSAMSIVNAAVRSVYA
jgi:predicted phage tail protein